MAQPEEISRGIIRATLRRGIRDMKKDPQRTVRRLADLGREFSKTPLQQYIFNLFQTLLASTESPYYEMLEQLLQYTDEETLLTFGMNVGYNSWIACRKQTVCHTPWILLPEMHAGKTDASALALTVAKGKRLGIYSYWIDETTPVCDELYRIFAAHPDCAFFHTIPRAGFTARQYRLLSCCRNVMTILDDGYGDPFETVVGLRSQGSLYGICHHYGNRDSLDIRRLIQPALRYRSAFYFLIAEPGCSEAARQEVARQVRALRMGQSYPVLLSDAYSDLSEIEKWLGNA